MPADWRTWLYAVVNALELADVHAAGSLSGSPAGKPFMVIRFDAVVPGPFRGVNAVDATIAVHDEPGSYVRIGEILEGVKAGIDAAVRPTLASGITWQGDSGDLADDGYGTIFRTTSYRLHGRNQ